MALKLLKQLPSGHEYEYHRILSLNYSGTQVRITIQSYKDQAARNAGKQAVKLWSQAYPINSFNLSNPDRPQAYEKLKAEDAPLDGAEDC